MVAASARTPSATHTLRIRIRGRRSRSPRPVAPETGFIERVIGLIVTEPGTRAGPGIAGTTAGPSDRVGRVIRRTNHEVVRRVGVHPFHRLVGRHSADRHRPVGDVPGPRQVTALR